MKLSRLVLQVSLLLTVCGSVAVAQQPSKAPESAADAAARKEQELAKIPRMTVEELKSRIAQGAPVFILDARMPADYDQAIKKIKGSIRISPYDLQTRMSEIPRDKDVVAYCS